MKDYVGFVLVVVWILGVLLGVYFVFVGEEIDVLKI